MVLLGSPISTPNVSRVVNSAHLVPSIEMELPGGEHAIVDLAKLRDYVLKSLAQLLEQQSPSPPCLVEPGLLPAQGILFVGGEPKVGKSLLVANLALSVAAGSDRLGFGAMLRRIERLPVPAG